MKKIFLLTYSLLLSILTVYGQENNLIEISGHVTDQEAKDPLPGVSVYVKGTVTGTVTNNTGDFSLRTRLRFPFTLVFSSVGFQQQEYEVTGVGSRLNVAMVTQT